MPRVSKSSEPISRRRAPAITPEDRESQMVSLAVGLAERQLIDGTASSQVITHYLKLASRKEILERARLENEVELLKAKTESMASSARVEELYQKAMTAFTRYSGGGEPSNDD